MATPVPLSSKLAATADAGYALRLSRQPHYRFDWHMHDCAMLLWPERGALDSRWVAEPGTPAQGFQLRRQTALLLPASAAHSTRSNSLQQSHGELYLRPELLGAHSRSGVIQLDAAAVAMLDALVAPALAPASEEPLVHALIAQLVARPLARGLLAARADTLPHSLRLMACFSKALDLELPLPTVEKVAAELGVSMRSLQRACATELGLSPVTLRRRALAAKARELLDGGCSPARASQQLGFTHSGHLNRLLGEIPDGGG